MTTRAGRTWDWGWRAGLVGIGESAVRTVLVVTQAGDLCADRVIAELEARHVPVFRCDLGDFPQHLQLSARLGAIPATIPATTSDAGPHAGSDMGPGASHDNSPGAGSGTRGGVGLGSDGTWEGSLHHAGRQLTLAELGCGYYRRPSSFTLPDQWPPDVRQWASGQARAALGGILAAHPWWLNHPADAARAEYKPLQLALAVQVGLNVPATLITNDPHEARVFLTRVGDAVIKPVGPGLIHTDPANAHHDHTHPDSGNADWDPGEGGMRVFCPHPVTAADIDSSVAGTAHLFQQQVPTAYEVRLTVVDHRYFTVRIDTSPETSPGITRIGWRADHPNVGYRVTDLPDRVRTAVAALLLLLRLRFATLDFVITPDGQWVFLGIDPNGRWAWLEDETGLTIAAAIAQALTRGHP